MKKTPTAIMLTMYGLTCLNLTADETKKPCLIQRGEEVIMVSNMPTFTMSKPITNSFVYIDGKYIEPPYVVSVSNLVVLINGILVQDYEPRVHRREYYTGRVGTTPETVGKGVDRLAKSYVELLELVFCPIQTTRCPLC